MGSWQLQEAKAKLSEVIATAKVSGPQTITQRGAETAVVVSISEWQRLQQSAPVAVDRKPRELTKEEREKSDAFLKLLQSCPDFEIPRRTIRMRKVPRS